MTHATLRNPRRKDQPLLPHPEPSVKCVNTWSEVFSAWCNLNVSNSDFDEMGERREEGLEWEGEEGGGEQGWYDYHAGECFDLDEELAKRKDKAFQRLKNDGRV